MLMLLQSRSDSIEALLRLTSNIVWLFSHNASLSLLITEDLKTGMLRDRNQFEQDTGSQEWECLHCAGGVNSIVDDVYK